MLFVSESYVWEMGGERNQNLLGSVCTDTKRKYEIFLQTEIETTSALSLFLRHRCEILTV